MQDRTTLVRKSLMRMLWQILHQNNRDSVHSALKVIGKLGGTCTKSLVGKYCLSIFIARFI